MERIDKIIQLIREQMVANAPGTGGGFGSSSDAKGPTAGFDPVIGKRYVRGGRGSRKKWLDYLRSSNGRRS